MGLPESWLLPGSIEEGQCCRYPPKRKQILNNYRPVSLLSICSKLFEEIIFDAIFQYLIENNLVNPNQSGFISDDSCINQLILVSHEIYASIDANPSLEVRGVLYIYLKLLVEYGMKGFFRG